MLILGYVPTELNTIIPTSNQEQATIIAYNKKRLSLPLQYYNNTISVGHRYGSQEPSALRQYEFSRDAFHAVVQHPFYHYYAFLVETFNCVLLTKGA
jgi:hypothetical protein